MKSPAWELECNTAHTWSFMAKVLAKLLVSQESGFDFLSHQSLLVTLATAKSDKVPNI